MCKVNAIPQGFHTITPHLVCAGAGEAMELYKRAFGAEELMRLSTPDGQFMHGSLRIGDSPVMLANESAACGAQGPRSLNGTPVTIHLFVEDADIVVAGAVAAGATLVMPLTEMFWGDRYGVVEDPWGHRWSVATHVADLTPDQIEKAGRKPAAYEPAPPERLMKYLCLICAVRVMEQMPEADADRHYREHREFTREIRQRGYFIERNRLLPADTATTLRVSGGRISVTDGPFAETKEQLGGTT